MPPPTEEQLRLIRDYEPVLYFHGGDASSPPERFFPSDAKRYLEHCALRKVVAGDDFGTIPVEAVNRLAAIEGEVQADRPIYIGKQTASGVVPGFLEYLQQPRNQEYFLSLTEWRPAGNPFPAERGYADLDRLADLYRNDEGLRASQFWYHAEFFDNSRLRTQLGQAFATGKSTIDLTKLLQPQGEAPPVLTEPALICYYLFYPGHDEGLNGCPNQDQAREFASFAGEWTCVAVLLDRAAPGATYAPKWIGLSNRNPGLIQFPPGDNKEIRTGMRILSWSAVTPLNNTHPQLAVARGSHALYLTTEQAGAVAPLTPVDPAVNSCGRADRPAGEIPPLPEEDTVIDDIFGVVKGIFIMVGKIVAGAVGGGLFGPLGAAAGGIAGLIGGALENARGLNVRGTGPVNPTRPTVDTIAPTGGGGNGRVVHPVGLLPPGVDPVRAATWRPDEVIDGRRYDSTVDRDAQFIWPRDLPAADYTLRWGPRVVADPQRRRAGMMFPNFWLTFFDSLVRAHPPRTVIFLTEGTPNPWTVESNWNNDDNMIECIGGGGGGVDGNLTVTAGTGGAGGGGAYSRTKLILTPGASIDYQVGAGGARGPAGGAAGNGGDTYFNGASFAASSVGARGGGGGNGATGGAGGAPDPGVEFDTFTGGAGANGDVAIRGSAGGGGAAGPSGNGATGSTAFEPRYGGGAGGGANGGSPGQSGGDGEIGHSGGNNSKSVGGGAGGGANQAGSIGTDGGGGGGGGGNAVSGSAGAGGAGGPGTEWDPSHGSGGGGGGGGAGRGTLAAMGGDGGPGGAFGGGGGSGGFSSTAGQPGKGGSGAPGLIVISYRD